MDSSSPQAPGRREVQLHGPRPSPLKVSKDSHKIKKQPPPPQPVVIYAVSPKVIHADTSNFMAIVQRFTGSTSGENSGGAVSPAARVAAIEKASVSPGKGGGDGVFNDDGGDERVEVNRAPGVLSPAPGSLPPIPQGFFSTPVSDPFAHDVMSSPWFAFSFTPSPSALLSSSIVSPTNSYDFFSQFWDS